MGKNVVRSVLTFIAVILSASLFAQSSVNGPRYALVIGNGSYADFGRLSNPVNDATDIAAALKGVGFQVTLLTDANRRQMNQALNDFHDSLAQDSRSAGFFWYAGHGIQSKGENYLLPLGANIKREMDLEDEAVSARKVALLLDDARNRVNIVVFDACRNNPIPSMGRSGTRGLTVVSAAPAESVIMYSTGAGQVAEDGSGRNSPFAQAFLKNMGLGGDITATIKAVTAETKRLTGGVQIPYLYSSLTLDFSLNPKASIASSTPASAKSPSFGAVQAATGNLTVKLATAGTVSVAGLSAQVPAGTVPVNDIAVGSQTVTVRYADGKTERANVTIPSGGTASLSFTYVPAPSPAPAVAVAASSPPPERAPGAPLHGEIFVKGGVFRMGSDSGHSDEKPVHEVRVSDFWMMKTEVTQKDYAPLVGTNPSRFKGDDHPVEQVSWYDAVAYANKLSERDGLRSAYTINGTNVSCDWSATGWRLPTEAEWEYAARGGQSTRGYTYSGGNDTGRVAWYYGNAGGQTHPVGVKDANELGFSDMSGNVWEWCWDWKANYGGGSQTDPRGASSGAHRVLRGGSWVNDASNARSALRDNNTPVLRNDDLGFRLVRSRSLKYMPAPPSVPAVTVAASAPPPERFSERGDFIRLPGGTFMMGSPSSEASRDSDETQRQVTVGAFSIGKYEVTQAEWTAVMGSNPSNFKGERNPVELVIWYQALVFCNKRSMREGRTPCYAIKGTTDPDLWGAVPTARDAGWDAAACDWGANGYRLPTEAEWEYACRAGTSTPFNTGNSITTSQANYNGNNPYNGNAKGEYRKKTLPVGSFPANSFGLQDTHGNVWEWCWDWYGAYGGSQSDPRGASSGTLRVVRGGSWNGGASIARSASRYGYTPGDRGGSLGFRLVRSQVR